MATAIPDYLTNMTLSTSPQSLFEQADALLLQATALKRQAEQLQSQVDTISDRANILTTTATGLQDIANQDRVNIQTLLDRTVKQFEKETGSTDYKPHNFGQLADLKARVEDGLATVEEVEQFAESFKIAVDLHHRAKRSQSPAPENPLTGSTVALSIETAQPNDETTTMLNAIPKRSFSADFGPAEDASTQYLQFKRPKHVQDTWSDIASEGTVTPPIAVTRGPPNLDNFVHYIEQVNSGRQDESLLDTTTSQLSSELPPAISQSHPTPSMIPITADASGKAPDSYHVKKEIQAAQNQHLSGYQLLALKCRGQARIGPNEFGASNASLLDHADAEDPPQTDELWVVESRPVKPKKKKSQTKSQQRQTLLALTSDTMDTSRPQT